MIHAFQVGARSAAVSLIAAELVIVVGNAGAVGVAQTLAWIAGHVGAFAVLAVLA